MRLRPCLSAKASICGPTITVPSSLASSQITAAGRWPASRQRSTAASVWPERISTPPSRAISGKTWPGRTKSLAPMLRIGERAHGVAALLGRDAGRHAVFDVDRDGEGGAERRVVHRHHRRELQAARFVAGQRRADDAAAVADDERHLLGGAQRGGDDHVAFVLAIVVVGDDDDFAARDRLDGLADWICHVRSPIERARAVEKVVRRHRAARLGEDALRRLARHPGAVAAAELRHRSGRDADPAREIGALDAGAHEPVRELHRPQANALRAIECK